MKSPREGNEQKPVAQESEAKKIDIKKLVSIVPPASELKKREKILKEKRIRVRFDESLPERVAKLSKDLARMLGISEGDKIEVVVAGRKKFIFTATLIDEEGTNLIYVYPEDLREKGVSDNSIATLRKHSSMGAQP